MASSDLVEFLRAHEMPVPQELTGPGARDRDVIVVVEDNPTYLHALVRTLEREAPEVEVVEASTGMDALLEIGRVEPGLIVLDYRLPDLNAVQVIERLLDPSHRLHSEVLVVTGGMPMEAEVALRQAGVRTIVNKADGMPVVVAAIRTALQARKVA